MKINKAAVIGAGVMGAGIAGQLANAGVQVYLLDIVPDGSDNRNIIAETALQKLLKSRPAGLMHRRNVKLITPGNLEDHLDWLNQVDWIVEAIIEEVEIKRDLYQKIESVRKPDTIVSSNTSTIPLSALTEQSSESFKQHFLITHFFNPPRYMRLLEVVNGDHTLTEVIDRIEEFGDLHLGKGIVACKDTPGFIGNRIGVFWLQCAVLAAIEMDLSVEQADAVMGSPIGFPKTGVFGLLDLIGIDLMPHIMNSMGALLPEHDHFHAINRVPDIVSTMLAKGHTGRKAKTGFYRMKFSGDRKIKQAIDLKSGEYRDASKPQLDCVAAGKSGGLQALLDFNDDAGRFAWRVLSKTLNYSALLIPEISEDINAVDRAMKLGYNWEDGPFELIDKIGADYLRRRLVDDRIEPAPILSCPGSMYRITDHTAEQKTVSGQYRSVVVKPGVMRLADVTRTTNPVKTNASASLWDIGDGIACFEFHTKMNALDSDILDLLEHAITLVQDQFGGLILYNDGDNFSAGANLKVLVSAIKQQQWGAVESIIRHGQTVFKSLKYTTVPVVGAPSGLALGGGCEILLHCDAIQAHAELYAGLVEVGVGLIPGWGGCKEMLHRWYSNKKSPRGPVPPMAKSFETISVAAVSSSAADAQDKLFLRAHDTITMNRDRLLSDAKNKALTLRPDYAPPEPVEINLAGPSGKATLDMGVEHFKKMGKVTPYDQIVADQLAYVLSGGDTDLTQSLNEDDLLKLERDAFMTLVQQDGTLARLEHMLNTGKPLRN